MQISARNSLRGTVQSIQRGAVNAEVVIEISPGLSVTSVITLASVDRLGLKEGQPAWAVIKASDVMLATE